MADIRTVDQRPAAPPVPWGDVATGPAPDLGAARDRVSPIYLAIKRAGDVLIAVIGIIACLPLWLVVVAAIRLDSRGPVFFLQKRPGHHGTPFKIFKFRTMHVDAEERLAEVLQYNREADDSLIRLENDPRVTRVGYWLRKWSIDETPQFLNVLLGEMSIVGPRPISRPIRDPRGLMRLEAIPGITGLWQTNGRKLTDCQHMLDLDMQYLKERGIVTDLRIIGRTFAAVLRAEGAE